MSNFVYVTIFSIQSYLELSDHMPERKLLALWAHLLLLSTEICGTYVQGNQWKPAKHSCNQRQKPIQLWMLFPLNLKTNINQEWNSFIETKWKLLSFTRYEAGFLFIIFCLKDVVWPDGTAPRTVANCTLQHRKGEFRTLELPINKLVVINPESFVER